MPIITNPQATDPQNNPSHSKLHRDEVNAINSLEGDIVKKFTKDIAGEIEDLTEKTTLHNDDLILIEDSEDIYNKKKVKKSNLSTSLNKATGSDIDTGTDDNKYITSKTIADSKISFTDGVETLNNKTIDLDNNTILNAGNILVGENLLNNSNFINVSTYGYGSLPEDWSGYLAYVIQGGFPKYTKQQALYDLGITDSELEGLWNLNEASGDAIDLSSNANTLTVLNDNSGRTDGPMVRSRDWNGAFWMYTSEVSNLLPSNSFIWSMIAKFDTLTNTYLLSFNKNTPTHHIHTLELTAAGKIIVTLTGLSSALTSDVVVETGKTYHISVTFDGTNLSLIINGIVNSIAVTGTIDNTGVADMILGRNTDSNALLDGFIQNLIITSASRPVSSIKNIWYNTTYKGVKVLPSTPSQGSAFQQIRKTGVGSEIFNRLYGKHFTIKAKMYQFVAETGFISCVDASGIVCQSDLTSVINDWVGVSATYLGDWSDIIDKIDVNLLCINNSNQVYYKDVMLYEGETPVAFWNASQNDWARFPRLMRMDPPQYKNAYSFEENRWYDFIPKISSSASMTILASSNANGKAMIIGKNGYVQASVLQSKGGTATTYGIDIEIPFIFNNVANTPYGYASIDNMFGQVGLYGDGNITGKSDKLQIRSSTNMTTDVSQRWAYIGATALLMD